jgi:hypothetical protein
LDIKRLIKRLLGMRGSEHPAEILRIRMQLEKHWAELHVHPECKQTFFRSGQLLVPDRAKSAGRCQVCAESLTRESPARLQRIGRRGRTKAPWEESTPDW